MIVPKFLDPLVLEEVDARLWRVAREFRYDSAILGARIIVPAGRLTDLASVPRVPFAYWLAGDTGRKAGVIHDELYVIRAHPRHVADAVFLEALAVEGVPRWRRGLMWIAVRVRGGAHWA